MTNGHRTHVEQVGNGRWARRFVDLLRLFTEEAGSPRTELAGQLLRRAAGTAVACEQMEVALARGEEIDFAEYGRLCERLPRMLRKLGIEKLKEEPKRQSLAEYLKGEAA